MDFGIGVATLLDVALGRVKEDVAVTIDSAMLKAARSNFGVQECRSGENDGIPGCQR